MNTILQLNDKVLFLSILSVGLIISASSLAQGLNNAPWSPQPANRASVAALMKQVENGNNASVGLGYVGGGGVTQLICGANTGEGIGASSNAQANSSCIILNNSNGSVNVNQDSDGDQTSNAQNGAVTSVEDTLNGTGSVDEVLNVLTGN